VKCLVIRMFRRGTSFLSVAVDAYAGTIGRPCDSFNGNALTLAEFWGSQRGGAALKGCLDLLHRFDGNWVQTHAAFTDVPFTVLSRRGPSSLIPSAGKTTAFFALDSFRQRALGRSATFTQPGGSGPVPSIIKTPGALDGGHLGCVQHAGERIVSDEGRSHHRREGRVAAYQGSLTRPPPILPVPLAELGFLLSSRKRPSARARSRWNVRMASSCALPLWPGARRPAPPATVTTRPPMVSLPVVSVRLPPPSQSRCRHRSVGMLSLSTLRV
jgi:hypothetical protein